MVFSLAFCRIVCAGGSALKLSILHFGKEKNQQKLFYLRPDYAVVIGLSGSFRQTYVHTTKKQHCISFTGIKLWNSIEHYIKNIKTEQAFKTKFKCF